MRRNCNLELRLEPPSPQFRLRQENPRVSLLTEGKEKKQKESKNILCSRVSFKEGRERKIKHVVFPSFI
ncbi:hypothetical protein Hanom_Chr15g01363601 [Helianthus anomalus]